MLLSVALMTAAMLATALLPTRAAIGPAAGWLLLALRCVMGFSVGGEYTGVVAYLLEGSPVRRRGLITSCASAASEVGGLLAVGVSALTVSQVSPANLDAWGWRIPFFVGAALAAASGSRDRRWRKSPEFLPPAGRRTRARGLPLQPRPHQPSVRHCALLFHLRAGIDHLLCRHHLRACLPDLCRRLRRASVAVAFDHRRRGGHRSSRPWLACSATASAASRC